MRFSLSLFGVLAFTAGSVVFGQFGPNLAQSVLVSTHGAACLDGTPPRYWLQRSESAVNSSRWYVHFMGGGWCESTASCAARAYSPACYLGSSNASCFPYQAPGDGYPGVPFNETMDFAQIPSCLGSRWCGGLMINDPAANPLTHDWNKVLVSYCDGFSYAGNSESVTTTTYNGSEVSLFYRGFRNIQAIFLDLATRFGMDAASDVILSGDSAGGLASYWHADFVAGLLPSARVIAAPDSGFFYVDESYPAWGEALAWIAAAGNVSDGLNQNCVAAQRAAGADPLLCVRPQVVAPHIATPLFVMNSLYDPALDSITGGESGANASNVQRLGDRLAQLVNETVLNRPGNAAFLTGCHEHCGQWGTNQSGPFADFDVVIDGVSAIPALAEWWQGGARNYWRQQAQYPCSDCCSGGS